MVSEPRPIDAAPDGTPDDDNPEWTAADVARARPASAFPDLAGALPLLVKKSGRPVGSTRSDRKQVTLRLPRHVIAFFQRDGEKGWQSRAIAALERAAAASE
jgi:uncharacterized protein (DUF4415 family)